MFHLVLMFTDELGSSLYRLMLLFAHSAEDFTIIQTWSSFRPHKMKKST